VLDMSSQARRAKLAIHSIVALVPRQLL
jgi:hypothetical protein